jgi:hypothetical protein
MQPKSQIRREQRRLVQRLPGPRGGRRKPANLRIILGDTEEGVYWRDGEPGASRVWHGPFKSLSAAEEDAAGCDAPR